MTITTTVKPTTATAADRVLDAFRDLDDFSPTSQIVAVTGLSKTTVGNALRKLAAAGDVIRMDSEGGSGWSLTPTRKAANKRAAAKLAKATKVAKAPTKALNDLATRQATAALADAKRTTRTRTRKTKDTEAKYAAQQAAAAQAARTPTGRRAKGVIDGEIITFMQANPDDTFGSYAVSKAIGSSAGAAYIALNRMNREGTVRVAQAKPVRYALA